jgi:hypothetical protein
MKISFSKLLTMIVLVTGYSLAVAGETTTDATVLKLSGSAKASIPGKSDAVNLQVGDHLPQGTSITTGSNSIAYIQTISGAVTTVEANTTVDIEKLSVTQNDAGVVTKQTVMLDLKSGNLVSTIDPSKRAINSYAVRTPKGVAAARGTQYAANVTTDTVTIAATADTVTLTSNLGVTYTIQGGNVTILGPGGVLPQTYALASLATSNPAVAQIIKDSVAAIATIISSGGGNMSLTTLTTLSSQIVAVASAADPTGASGYSTQITDAINKSPNSAYAGDPIAAKSATSSVQTSSDAGLAVANGTTPTASTPSEVIKVITPSTGSDASIVSPGA